MWLKENYIYFLVNLLIIFVKIENIVCIIVKVKIIKLLDWNSLEINTFARKWEDRRKTYHQK